MVQWLGLSTPSAGGLISTPGQEIRAYMPQLRSDAAKLINKNIFLEGTRDSSPAIRPSMYAGPSWPEGCGEYSKEM